MSIPPVDEARIREMAFLIWQQEGCPDGCAEEHWHRARARLEAEAMAPPVVAARAAKPRDARARLAATLAEPVAARPRAKSRSGGSPNAPKATGRAGPAKG